MHHRKLTGLTQATFLAVLSTVLMFALSTAAARAAWQPGPELYGDATTAGVPITMRDGVVLRADIHYPTDKATGAAAKGPFPVVVVETPYGTTACWAVLCPQSYLVHHGYIVAIVAVRGTGRSEGQFQLLGPIETQDSVQVVDWASKLPDSTGKVGMVGASYMGIVQLNAAAAVGPGSPLKAIFPEVASGSPYRDLFVDGGLLNTTSDPPLIGIVLGTGLAGAVVDGGATNDPLGLLAGRVINQPLFYGPLLAELAGDGDVDFDQSFWGQRSAAAVLDRIVANRVPAYLIGGLYDVFQRSETLNFAGLQNATAGRPTYAPMTSRQQTSPRYQMLIGPWYHMGAPLQPAINPLELRWFDQWLKHQTTGITNTHTPLHVIDPSGTALELPRVPLGPARPYYLGPSGSLTTTPPTATSASDDIMFTGATLRCDRQTEQWLLGLADDALSILGLKDPCTNNELSPPAGPTGTTYTTAPFTKPTVLAGPIGATIYATATTTDTEWVVKVDDVAPDGTVTQLTSGALLGSLRAIDNSRSWISRGNYELPYHPYTKASKQPVTPGAVTRYDVEVRGTYDMIGPGHRIRVTILSSEVPHLLALPADLLHLIGGRYAIQRTTTAPSRIVLPLAPPSSLAVRRPR